MCLYVCVYVSFMCVCMCVCMCAYVPICVFVCVSMAVECVHVCLLTCLLTCRPMCFWLRQKKCLLRASSCNSLLSSIHTLFVNILWCVRLYIKRKYYYYYSKLLFYPAKTTTAQFTFFNCNFHFTTAENWHNCPLKYALVKCNLMTEIKNLI